MNIKWEEGAPAPIGCEGHTAVWLNELVYVGGGYGAGHEPLCTINCYDPAINSWGPTINTPYCYFVMTTLNNKLVTVGGQDEYCTKTDQLLIMDAGQVRKYTKMITARSDATAVGHQGMLIVTGGLDDLYKAVTSTELYDSNQGQWYECSDLPQPHCDLKPMIANKILYLLGGGDLDGGASMSVFTVPLDTLSTHQLTWNVHQKNPWRQSVPVSLNGKHLLIIGGYKENIYTHTTNIHKLDKVSHSWEVVGQIPSVRERFAAVSTADNIIIVIGGWNNKGEITNTVWIGSCEPQ